MGADAVSGRLIRSPSLRDLDAFYAELVKAHEGLADERGALLNARSALILANQSAAPKQAETG
jgi:hypothetical protein